MTEIDRDTARALVEAGYMSLKEYVERFGNRVDAPSTAPDDCEEAEPVSQARRQQSIAST
jgi:hypothetical protein